MKKFKIPKIPQTTNKSIRFPNDVIDEVEAALVGTDCTFSAFVVDAVRVALDNLKEEEEQQQILPVLYIKNIDSCKISEYTVLNHSTITIFAFYFMGVTLWAGLFFGCWYWL